MAWENQPASERAAGQPLDTVFWQKWLDRLAQLSSVDVPPLIHAQTVTFVDDTWTTLSKSHEIWIPPAAYGYKLVLRCSISTELTNDDPGAGEHLGQTVSRFKIGSIEYSTSEITKIGCKIEWLNEDPPVIQCKSPTEACPGCDGDSTDGGVFYTKEHTWTVPESMLGTVQTVVAQLKRGNENTPEGGYVNSGYIKWYWEKI